MSKGLYTLSERDSFNDKNEAEALRFLDWIVLVIAIIFLGFIFL